MRYHYYCQALYTIVSSTESMISRRETHAIGETAWIVTHGNGDHDSFDGGATRFCQISAKLAFLGLNVIASTSDIVSKNGGSHWTETWF
jgi:hypothetical protein